MSKPKLDLGTSSVVPLPDGPQDDASAMLSKDDTKGRSSWLDDTLNKAIDEEESDGEPSLSMAQQLVRSNKFTLATTGLIVVNGILIGIETDHGDGSVGWQALEIIFLVLYLIELFVRLFAEGLKSLLTDGWVRFDAIVLFVALADMIVLTPILAESGGGGEAKSVAMVLRIMRLMKLARIVRLLRFFKELWLLVASMGSAMRTLGWTFLLLTIVLYVFAILFVKMIGKETEDEDLALWFGNIGAAMFTLFQIMTLESWGEITRVIWTTDRKFMLFVVLLFIAICSFAIMNTVMAVIVEHTLKEAVDQQSDLIKKAEEELQRMTEALLEIFLAADIDGGGTLDKEEFVSALDSPEARKLLTKMDLGDDIGSLEPEEIGMLFDTIDIDRNQVLSPKEFVDGIMQMRGTARARRIFELHCTIQKMRNQNSQDLRTIYSTVRKLNGKTSEPDPDSPSGPSPSEPMAKSVPAKSVQTNPGTTANEQAVAQLEMKIETGLAKQRKAVSELEAKFDSGMSKVNAQLNALMGALAQPAG